MLDSIAVSVFVLFYLSLTIRNKKDSDCDWSGLKIHKGKSHKLQSTTPVTTPVSISSPVTTPTPLTEPVFRPSIPFIFSTTQIFRQTELPLNCDKCQFSCDPLRVTQDHRKEKHRLWECRRCGDSYNNQQSFDEHDRGSRKCREHPYMTAYFPYGAPILDYV